LFISCGPAFNQRPVNQCIKRYDIRKFRLKVKVLKTWMSWMWLRNWFALIYDSGTTDNVSKWKHDYYRHSMLYLYYRQFKFQNDHTTGVRIIADYHIAHAESDTSSRLGLNHRRCGWLKHTPWKHGYKLTTRYIWAYMHHYTVEVVVTARTSRPSVALNVSSRSRHHTSHLQPWQPGYYTIGEYGIHKNIYIYNTFVVVTRALLSRQQ